MFTYLIFNIAIVAGPLLLSFEKKLEFWKRWPNLAISYLIGGAIFVTWDSISTDLGHWSFNDDHLIGLWIFGIPFEEILFFFTVPYACLFSYEIIKYHMEERKVPFNRKAYIGIGTGIILSSFLFWNQGYTFIVLIFTGITIIVLSIRPDLLLRSRQFWTYILATTILFMIFNMVLTALPVVRYDPGSIWGGEGLFNGRFFTIPLEDFFYNFSLLSTYLLVYLASIHFIDLRRKKSVRNES